MLSIEYKKKKAEFFKNFSQCFGKIAKGMERKRETVRNDLLPKKGNPLNETVYYKIGGTVFEIETSCDGSGLPYDKMTRLIKAETVETPADNKSKERYNSDSNLFVGRSLQEEGTMKPYPDNITALYARFSQSNLFHPRRRFRGNFRQPRLE